MSKKKQFSLCASGLVKFVFLRYLNNRINHKNSNAFYNTSIPLTFALLAEDACPTPCEPGLPVHLHCLTVKKKQNVIQKNIG